MRPGDMPPPPVLLEVDVVVDSWQHWRSVWCTRRLRDALLAALTVDMVNDFDPI